MHKKVAQFIFIGAVVFTHTIHCGKDTEIIFSENPFCMDNPYCGLFEIVHATPKPLTEVITEVGKEVANMGVEGVKRMVEKTPEISSKVLEITKKHPWIALTFGTGTVIAVVGVRKYFKIKSTEQNQEKVKKNMNDIGNKNVVSQVVQDVEQNFMHVENNLNTTEQLVQDLNNTQWNDTEQQKSKRIIDNIKNLFLSWMKSE